MAIYVLRGSIWYVAQLLSKMTIHLDKVRKGKESFLNTCSDITVVFVLCWTVSCFV